MNEFMSQYDVVICPSFAGSQLRITNLTGHPAVSLPTGFNKDHLPTSITLLGKLYDEATLLAVAKAYQQVTQWDKMHPEMFK
jgi:Asp-tRNA(Asn)/Glu-tRNA(Gln) amidotransferase A subunit family amidase